MVSTNKHKQIVVDGVTIDIQGYPLFANAYGYPTMAQIRAMLGMARHKLARQNIDGENFVVTYEVRRYLLSRWDLSHKKLKAWKIKDKRDRILAYYNNVDEDIYWQQFVA